MIAENCPTDKVHVDRSAKPTTLSEPVVSMAIFFIIKNTDIPNIQLRVYLAQREPTWPRD